VSASAGSADSRPCHFGQHDAVEVGRGQQLGHVIGAEPQTGRVDAACRAAGQGEDGVAGQHVFGDAEEGLDGAGNVDEDVDRTPRPPSFEGTPVSGLDDEVEDFTEPGPTLRTLPADRIGHGRAEGLSGALRSQIRIDFGDSAHEGADDSGDGEHLIGAGGHDEQALCGQQ
jgi:hypothetical protein